MSEITHTRCDGCGKTVPDVYEAIGWLRLDGSITLTNGRAEDRRAKTRFACRMERDFCGVSCLQEFLMRLTCS